MILLSQSGAYKNARAASRARIDAHGNDAHSNSHSHYQRNHPYHLEAEALQVLPGVFAKYF